MTILIMVLIIISFISLVVSAATLSIAVSLYIRCLEMKDKVEEEHVGTSRIPRS